MDNDPDVDHQAQDADDYYQDIVVEDAASMMGGCLGSVIVMIFAVGLLFFRL
jgi:hypothetical protein